MKRVIWCTPGRSDEATWIAQLTGRGFTIVRRCVEATDVLAAASIEDHAAVVIDMDTPRLSADIIAAVPRGHERVILAIGADADAVHRARAWGLTRIIDGLGADLIDRVAAELRAPGDYASNTGGSAPAWIAPPDGRRGLTVVYGPSGAPGRSTVALGLAEAWSHAGERVCLVDADTIGPSLSLIVGMTEDVSGVLVASRYADQGALDARSLGTACRRLGDRLWLLSGIGSAERWQQVRPRSLEHVLAVCAANFDRVVIDTGPLLAMTDHDEALTSPRRDGTTITALRSSGSLVVVTQVEAVSMLRLTAELPALLDLVDHSQITVVANRAPRREKQARARVQQVLAESGIRLPIFTLPDDASIPSSRRTGSLLAENPGTGKVRRSLRAISDAVAT